MLVRHVETFILKVLKRITNMIYTISTAIKKYNINFYANSVF